MDGNVQAGVSAQSEQTVDAGLGKQMESLVSEACERATFHRIETERWERAGRAAVAALREVHSAQPVGQVTAESLMGEDTAKMPDRSF